MSRPSTGARKPIVHWTSEEHSRFVFAVRTYGKNWTKITEHVATRAKASIAGYFFAFKKKAKKNPSIADSDIIEILDRKKGKKQN